MTSPLRRRSTKLLAAPLLAGALSLATAAAAFADDAPTVATGAASLITSTSATVAGTVDPHGSAVSDCHVEYSTDTSYSYNSTCSPDPGDGSGAVAVTAALTDLQPATTYHFRVVATNAGGTTDGADATFTTAQPPVPIVTTGGVAGFSVEQATVNGTINPNGSLANCSVEFGPTTDYAYSTLCAKGADDAGTTAEPVQAVLNGLVPGVTIHYRFVSTNAAGKGVGADQTFFTPAIVGSQQPGANGSGGGNGGTSGGGNGGGRSAKLALPGSGKVSGGRAKLRVSCSGAPCRGTLKLTVKSGRRTITVGTAKVSLPAGRSATVTVRLTAAGRAQLRRHHGLTVSARGAGAGKTLKLRA